MEDRERLMSLDALRGFDMFFITGGAGLIVALCEAFGVKNGWLARQMEHVPWEGLAHHDTIFPLFLFLAGVSWPFSLASQRARGRTTWQVIRKVFVRSIVLFLLGLSCGGILALDPSFRIPSVLGQIGLSWGVAALLFMGVRKAFARILLVSVILVAYWALLHFVSAPDSLVGLDSYSREGNIVSWLDRTLMPHHIYVKGVYDPESLFSVCNGVAMALIGMSAGAVLQNGRQSKARRAACLGAAASGLLAAGLFFVFVLGDWVVKSLWTSSFVLLTAAYSMTLLTLFYWMIDVKGWRKWTLYFRVIGMNSILIYMAQMYYVLPPLHKRFFAAASERIGCPWGGVFDGLTYCLFEWIILYCLYRKKIFLKV